MDVRVDLISKFEFVWTLSISSVCVGVSFASYKHVCVCFNTKHTKVAHRCSFQFYKYILVLFPSYKYDWVLLNSKQIEGARRCSFASCKHVWVVCTQNIPRVRVIVHFHLTITFEFICTQNILGAHGCSFRLTSTFEFIWTQNIP